MHTFTLVTALISTSYHLLTLILFHSIVLMCSLSLSASFPECLSAYRSSLCLSVCQSYVFLAVVFYEKVAAQPSYKKQVLSETDCMHMNLYVCQCFQFVNYFLNYVFIADNREGRKLLLLSFLLSLSLSLSF